MTTNKKVLNILSTIKLVLSILSLVCTVLGGIVLTVFSVIYSKNEAFRSSLVNQIYEGIMSEPDKLEKLLNSLDTPIPLSSVTPENIARYVIPSLAILFVFIIFISIIYNIYNLLLAIFGRKAAKTGKKIVPAFVMALISIFFPLANFIKYNGQSLSFNVNTFGSINLSFILNVLIAVFAYLVMRENKNALAAQYVQQKYGVVSSDTSHESTEQQAANTNIINSDEEITTTKEDELQ